MDVDEKSNNGHEPRRRLSFEDSGDLSPTETQLHHSDNGIRMDILDASEGIHDLHRHVPKELIPEIGMEFANEDAAYKFYKAYAKAFGFGTKLYRSHKDKLTGKLLDKEFCCDKEGERRKDPRDVKVKCHRPITRFDCRAMMKISRRQTDMHQTDVFRIVKFVAEHSHDCVTPSKSHLFRSHRDMSQAQKHKVDLAISCGIPQKNTMELMATEAGGPEHLGLISDDCKNYLRTKRMIKMELGDTGGVLEYLKGKEIEDPQFFYAIQVDEDALITNIFWIDAKMKSDYLHFGDVVCFDTTYRKNKDGRPFALFVGVNNHTQTSIFGAALLYDETAKTFSWLFDTFANAMSKKKPQTMLTDQAPAIASALASQWPKTYHRLCVWHINQNAASHLSDVYKKYKGPFTKDFNRCIYDYEEEEDFIEAWNQMIEKYNIRGKAKVWLDKMFNIRKKWALVYGRETFCANMSATQRSESMNAAIKKYVSYKNDLSEFFKNFERLLQNRRYKEIRANFRTSQSTPSMQFPVQILKHAASVYTLEVFGVFEDELCKAHDSSIEVIGEEPPKTHFKVTPLNKRYHRCVSYDSESGSMSCSCKKYEFIGVLCSHALKVLTAKNIVRIPDQYIMNRWKKTAKRRSMQLVYDDLSHVDPKEMMNYFYKDLCQYFGQLVTRAEESKKSYRVAKDGLWNLIQQVEACFEEGEMDNPDSDATTSSDGHESETAWNGKSCIKVR